MRIEFVAFFVGISLFLAPAHAQIGVYPGDSRTGEKEDGVGAYDGRPSPGAGIDLSGYVGTKPPKDLTGLSPLIWWRFHDERSFRMAAARGQPKSDTPVEVYAEARGGDVKVIRTILAKNLDDPSEFVRAATLIALGKTAGESFDEKMLAALGDRSVTVKEAATLGLGLYGSTKALQDLTELFTNSGKGRELTKADRDVPETVRLAAALAIGCIGAKVDLGASGALGMLVRELENPEIDADRFVAIALALMLMKAREAVPVLEKRLVETEQPLIRAWALTALGRIGERSTGAKLEPVFTDRFDIVRQSAAAATGGVFNPRDAAGIEKLLNEIKIGPNLGSRHFALMSLARLGRDEDLPTLERIASGKDQTTTRATALLAMGVFGAQRDPKSRAELCATAARLMKRDPQALVRMAGGLALGLSGGEAAAPDMIEALKTQEGAAAAQGIIAGLAAIGAKEAIPAVRPFAAKGSNAVRETALCALGVFHDVESTKLLIDVLKDGKNKFAMNGAARGLVFDKNVHTIKLLEPMVDRTVNVPEAGRVFAIAALGGIGDKDNASYFSRLREGLNPFIVTEPIKKLLSVF